MSSTKSLPLHTHVYYSEEDIFGNNENLSVHITGNECSKIRIHSHEFWELNVLISGKAQHYIGNMTVPAKTGDVFVIPPNTNHGYQSESNFSIKYIVLKNSFWNNNYTNLRSVDGFSKLFELEPHLRQVHDANLFLHLSASKLETVKNDITRIDYLNSQNRTMQAGFVCLDLICQFCHYMSDNNSKIQESSDLYGILKVLAHIHDNYGEKITTDDLAAIAKMSPATFNRHFKKIMKQPPMRYLILYRIKAAQKMLNDKLYNKTEIAQKCGFYDVSHMEKYLKANQ